MSDFSEDDWCDCEEDGFADAAAQLQDEEILERFVDRCSKSGTVPSPSSTSLETVPRLHNAVESRLSSGTLASCSAYAAHRAAFNNDSERVRAILKGLPKSDWLHKDQQGNTVLHVAVLAQAHDTVRVLVAMGFPLSAKNARGWIPLDEAISMRDRTAVADLFAAQRAAFKLGLKEKKQQLKKTLHDMPDCSLQVKWELGSALLGLVLRRVAPHDIYTLYKYKTLLRVDGSLMGISNLDEETESGSSFLPEWKRGHFSLMLDTAVTPFRMQFVDHNKRTYIDLSQAMRDEKPTLQDQVDTLLSGGCAKTKFHTSEVRFKPLKGWLTSELREKVEGWNTQVYECTGKLQAVTRSKTPINIPQGATFDDYLALQVDEDETEDLSMDLMSMGQQMDKKKSSNGRSSSSGSGMVMEPNGTAAANGKAASKRNGSKYRRFSGRCWMADNFPLSLQQLIPLLDVVANTNRHIGKVANFLTKYGRLDLFPVKMQIPLIFTVYLLVTVSHFRLLQPGDLALVEDFYQVPAGFTQKDPKKKSSSKHKKNDSLTFM